MRNRTRWRSLSVAALICATAALTGCHGGNAAVPPDPTTVATPTVRGACGQFRIAYDPTNGYEASAFIIGTIAKTRLDCSVTYVKTTSRKAWRLVASGGADVYLDAYGVNGLRAKLATPGGPVTVVGPNGVHGTVAMLAPYFMSQRGLDSARDLADVDKIGWGATTPAITTVPALLALARAFVDFQHLDYTIRNYNQVALVKGMGSLMQQPSLDNTRGVPDVYLAEGPRGLLSDRPGQSVVDVPGSASQPCEPDKRSTLCSFDAFDYVKIANTAFAKSGSPAYSLVYNYRLDKASVANILELVALSGYDVGPADVASWLNTHANIWRRWLP
jgi:glycine betaine/proline transport system substrate-binding protein